MALISEKYRDLNATLHRTSRDYGAGAAHKFGARLQELMRVHGKDVLDYGCGKGTLGKAFPNVRSYDPCVPEFSGLPLPADLVICRDVMEHVESECIDEVLDHIRELTKTAVFFVIVTRPAAKLLPDGRNTHISVHPQDWWLNKLMARFKSVAYTFREDVLEATCE